MVTSLKVQPLEGPSKEANGDASASAGKQDISAAAARLGDSSSSSSLLLCLLSPCLLSLLSFPDKGLGIKSPYNIHPDNPRKMKWDLLLAALIIYSVVSVPFSIGFDADPSGFTLVLNIFVDVMFFFDMCVNFFTGYINNDGDVVWDLGMIARHYLTGWFTIDFLSTVPIEHIAKSAMGGGDSSTLRFVKLIRILRLVRLVKLMKVLNIGQLLDELEDKIPINRNLISICQMLLQIVFLAHLLGCFWHMTTKTTAEAGDLNWISSVYGYCNDISTGKRVPLSAAEGLCNGTFVFQNDGCYECRSTSLRYTASIYWAVTTMATVGYGDINTQNSTEKGYAVLVMLIGASIFGYTVGMMSVLVQSSDIHSYTVSKKMGSLKDYMMSRSVPQLLQKRLRRQWKYSTIKASVFDEKALVSTLPQSLQLEVMTLGKNKELCDQLPSLLSTPGSVVDPGYLSAIIPCLQPCFLDDAEVLYEEKSVGWHCYWITDGKIKMSLLVDDFPVVACVKNRDQCFGQNFITDGSVSITDAVSSGTTHLMSLSRKNATKIFEEWPELEIELLAGKKDFDEQIQTFSQVAAGGNQTRLLAGDDDAGKDEDNKTISSSELWQKHLIVHPEAERKVYWDLMIGAIIIYSVIVVPLRIAFSLKPEGAEAVLDIIMDICFFIDMFIAFRTAFFDSERQLVYDTSKIRVHYLKGWFTIDFLSTVPIDQIAKSFVSDPSKLRIIKLLRILRLARLAKLFNLLKNGPLYEKFEDVTSQINSGVFRMPSLFMFLLFCAHIIACIWYGISSSDEASWVRDYFFGGDATASIEYGSIMANGKESTASQYYLASFYWALATMTTVGYGDISASRESEFEMSIAMCCMLLGTTIFAYVVGEIVMVVLNFDPSENLLKEKKMKFKAFIEEKSLSIGTKQIGRRQIQYLQAYQSMFDIEELFQSMPEFLLQKIVENNYCETIQHHAIFKEVAGEFHGFEKLFIPLLKPCFGEKDSLVQQVGQASLSMFFVDKGWLQVCDRPAHAKGDAPKFGVGQHFSEACMLVPKKQRATLACSVRCMSSYCHLLELRRNQFFSIEEVCPRLFEVIKDEWGRDLQISEWVTISIPKKKGKAVGEPSVQTNVL